MLRSSKINQDIGIENNATELAAEKRKQSFPKALLGHD
jgi:hypothetical protein